MHVYLSTAFTLLERDNSSIADAFNFDIESIRSKMFDSVIAKCRGKRRVELLFTVGDILNVQL